MESNKEIKNPIEFVWEPSDEDVRTIYTATIKKSRTPSILLLGALVFFFLGVGFMLDDDPSLVQSALLFLFGGLFLYTRRLYRRKTREGIIKEYSGWRARYVFGSKGLTIERSDLFKVDISWKAVSEAKEMRDLLLLGCTEVDNNLVVLIPKRLFRERYDDVVRILEMNDVPHQQKE